jgi:hypothetical protein
MQAASFSPGISSLYRPGEIGSKYDTGHGSCFLTLCLWVILVIGCQQANREI